MRTTLMVLLALFLFSCQQSEQSGSFSTEEAATAKMTSDRSINNEQDDREQQLVDEKKLIRKAYLEMEVNDYEKAKAEVNTIIKSTGATVERSEDRSSGYKKESNVTIRVVPEKLESLLDQLAGLARNIDRKAMETEDVTRQYIDLETRLASKRAVIERYQQLLQQAGNVEEVLLVEENLRKVTEEMETTEAQLRYLKNQVGKSTLYLTFYEPVESVSSSGPSFGKKIVNALRGGWQFLLNVIVFLIQIWPLTILTVVGIVLLIRRRKQRGTGQTT